MILGIGSDLIDIRRVEKVMRRYEERFIARCFTEIERAKAERRRGGDIVQRVIKGPATAVCAAIGPVQQRVLGNLGLGQRGKVRR